MSYAAVYGLRLGESAESILELPNAWRFIPFIWRKLFEKHVSTTVSYLEGLDRLWPLVDTVEVAAEHRAVLAMTGDKVYIERQHYARAASDLRKFYEHFSGDDTGQHLLTIAELLETDPDYPAIGFYGTSVGECLWETGCGYDPETDTDIEIPVQWDDAWSLYERLPSQPTLPRRCRLRQN